MKKIFILLCVFLAIKSTDSIAIPPPGGESVMPFAGEDWRVYFGNGDVGIITEGGNFYTQHGFFNGDNGYHELRIAFATYADQSKILSFDWEIKSLLTPITTTYGTFFESKVFGIELFRDLIYPNEVYNGHTEVIIKEGSFYTLSGFSTNYYMTPPHQYMIHTRLTNVSITPLTEPQTMLLMILGMVSLLLYRSTINRFKLI